MIKTVIGCDTSQVEQGRHRVAASFQGMASAAQSVISPLVGGLGIAASIYTATRYVHGLAAELDAVAKAARQAQVNPRNYQVLAEAFKMGGASGEELTQTLNRIRQQLALAAAGNVQAIALFEALNLSVSDLQSLSPDQLMVKIAQSVRQIPDGYQQAMIATQLFGEKSMKVVDTLAGGLDGLKREMEATGRIFDEDQMTAAEEYNDSLTKIDRSLKSIIVQTDILKGMAWGFGVIEEGGQLPARVDDAKKDGGSGLYTDKTYLASSFILDYVTLGNASNWLDQAAGGKSTIQRGLTSEERMAQNRKEVEREMAEPPRPKSTGAYFDESMARYREALKRQDESKRAVQMGENIAFGNAGSPAQNAAAARQLQIKKELAEVVKQIEATGHKVTEEEKKQLETSIKAAAALREKMKIVSQYVEKPEETRAALDADEVKSEMKQRKMSGQSVTAADRDAIALEKQKAQEKELAELAAKKAKEMRAEAIQRKRDAEFEALAAEKAAAIRRSITNSGGTILPELEKEIQSQAHEEAKQSYQPGGISGEQNKEIEEKAKKAAQEELDIKRLVAAQLRAIEATGAKITDEMRQRVELGVRAAVVAENEAQAEKKAAEAAEARKRLVESMGGQLGDMKNSILRQLGMVEAAAVDDAIKQMEAAAGRALTKGERETATRIGKLRARLETLDQNRQQIDGSIQGNSLASQGGWYKSVVMPDVAAINAGTVQKQAETNDILQSIEKELKDLKEIR